MKIEIDELNGFEARTVLAGIHSCSTGVNKKIEMVSKVENYKFIGRFVVINNGEEIMQTTDLELAVECLNALK